MYKSGLKTLTGRVWEFFFENYANKKWYPILLFLLAILDIFIAIVPLNFFLATAVVNRKKHWLWIALLTSTGTLVGASMLASLILWNQPWLFEHFPGVFQSQTWSAMDGFLENYGEWAVLVGSALTFPLQPFIVGPILAGADPVRLLVFLYVGNFIKHCSVAGGVQVFTHKIKRPRVE